MARRSARKAQGRILPALTLAAAASLLSALPAAFVPAPKPQPSPAAGALAAAGTLLAPLAAHADLPPLEDLPLNDIKDPKLVFPDTWTGPLGVELPANVFGLPLWAIIPPIALTWALSWVYNTKPFDQKYVTYIGAGELPPEGYTNPLDVRIREDEDEEEEGLNSLKDMKKKKTSSAVI
mmetsp:Transcript_33257/g.75268  ORF Transcript_33257/g.75268 Transcript_33257/m.75268 type:complete len:179 (-) Transcript_33257:147-683(-)